MDMTLSGKLVIHASKKVLDSINYAFDEDFEADEIIEIDDNFEGATGECLEDAVENSNGKYICISFEESYEVYDVDLATELVQRILISFPSIRKMQFDGTVNIWSSGEHIRFQIQYENRVLTVAQSDSYFEYLIYDEAEFSYERILELYGWNEETVSEEFLKKNRGKKLYSKAYETISSETELLSEMLLGSWEEVGVEYEEISCDGLVFVITGKLCSFENRDAIIEYIEECEGIVTGSVSKNTDFLVNNDIDSSTSKNIKAKELGIPIISEEEFIVLFGEG